MGWHLRRAEEEDPAPSLIITAIEGADQAAKGVYVDRKRTVGREREGGCVC